jgi:hypothetical protein
LSRTLGSELATKGVRASVIATEFKEKNADAHEVTTTTTPPIRVSKTDDVGVTAYINDVYVIFGSDKSQSENPF